MKLKEQREHLKAQGNKHEDNIMKENAKLQVRSLSVKPLPFYLKLSTLQKEVKYRIAYMKEYMEKIDKGLDEDARASAEQKEREKERAWREQERQREELERRRERESSRDSEEEKERKKKKKKKEKSRTRSSSSSSDENERLDGSFPCTFES